MSKKDASSWLRSLNKYQGEEHAKLNQLGNTKPKATVVSIASGKGGVGKTSIAVKFALLLAEQNKKTLLIDCDFNLSNTHVKLGLPLTGNLYDLVTSSKPFDECLYKNGNFHLLAGCNGNLEIFENGVEFDKLIIDIISEHEESYDYILLDCPAGLTKEALNLNAYSDHRFIIVTPDKSSITDSYSLVKILATKYAIRNNHLIINKISTIQQYKRIVKILGETAESFLSVNFTVLGGIVKEDLEVDNFDKILFKSENSAIHKSFVKVLKTYLERSEELLLSNECIMEVFGKEPQLPTENDSQIMIS